MNTKFARSMIAAAVLIPGAAHTTPQVPEELTSPATLEVRARLSIGDATRPHGPAIAGSRFGTWLRDLGSLFARELPEETLLPTLPSPKRSSIDELARFVPSDVACWTVFSGDLHALIHYLERSPVREGVRSTLDVVETWFDLLVEGRSRPSFQQLIDQENRWCQEGAAQIAQGQARRELPEADEDRLRERVKDIEDRLVRESLLPPLRFDPRSEASSLGAVLDYLASVAVDDSKRDAGEDVPPLGRIMFLMRKDDYGDLREGLNDDQRQMIPDFYAGRVGKPAPLWVVGLWIEDRVAKKFDTALSIFLRSLPAEGNTLRVELVKQGIGQWTMNEYWCPFVPGPGQIVTAMGSTDRKETGPTHLVLIGNHVRLIEDLMSSVLARGSNRPKRLRDDARFRTWMQGIDQGSHLFLLMDGHALATLFENPSLRDLGAGLLSIRATNETPRVLAMRGTWAW
ncbi:MAG: hypothetical protein H6834_08520 [Planctomycetes bacterium]|nr:hypothetical protein [Planctomycetota bacterium]